MRGFDPDKARIELACLYGCYRKRGGNPPLQYNASTRILPVGVCEIFVRKTYYAPCICWLSHAPAQHALSLPETKPTYTRSNRPRSRVVEIGSTGLTNQSGFASSGS